MAEFVELGIAAVEKLVDNQFDRIPDRAFHPEKEIRRFRKRRKEKDRSRSTSRSGDEAKVRERPRRHDSRDDYSEDGVSRHYTDGVYDASRNSTSRTDPYWEEAERRTRERYAYPAPAPVGPDEDPRYPAQHRGPYPYPNDAYTYPPNGYSDYPPPNTHYPLSSGTYTPVEEQRLRRRSHSTNQRSSHPSRPPLKQRSSSLDRSGPKSSSHFSSTDRGLGAGGLGALAGGFMAQEWAKRDKRGRKADPRLLTFVGAAIGGLGANALEGKWERGKMKERERERDRRSAN